MGVLGYGGTVVFKLKRGLGTPVDADITDLYTPSHPQFLIAAPRGKHEQKVGPKTVQDPRMRELQQKAKASSQARHKRAMKDKAKEKPEAHQTRKTEEERRQIQQDLIHDEEKQKLENEEKQKLQAQERALKQKQAQERERALKQKQAQERALKQKQKRGNQTAPVQNRKASQSQTGDDSHDAHQDDEGFEPVSEKQKRPIQGATGTRRANTGNQYVPDVQRGAQQSRGSKPGSNNFYYTFARRVEDDLCKPIKTHLWLMIDHQWERLMKGEIEPHDILPGSSQQSNIRAQDRLQGRDLEKIQKPSGFTFDDTGAIVSSAPWEGIYIDKRVHTKKSKDAGETRQEVAYYSQLAGLDEEGEEIPQSIASTTMENEAAVQQARLFDRLVRVWRHCHSMYDIMEHYSKKIHHEDLIDNHTDIDFLQDQFQREIDEKSERVNSEDLRCFKFLAKKDRVAARCFVYCLHETLLHLTFRMRFPLARGQPWWSGMAGLFLTSYEAPMHYLCHKYGPLATLMRYDQTYFYQNMTAHETETTNRYGHASLKFSTTSLKIESSELKTCDGIQDLISIGTRLLDSYKGTSAQLVSCLAFHELLSLQANPIVSKNMVKGLIQAESNVSRNFLDPRRQDFISMCKYKPPNELEDPNRRWLFAENLPGAPAKTSSSASATLSGTRSHIDGVHHTLFSFMHGLKRMRHCPIRARLILGTDWDDTAGFSSGFGRLRGARLKAARDNIFFDLRDWTRGAGGSDTSGDYRVAFWEGEIDRGGKGNNRSGRNDKKEKGGKRLKGKGSTGLKGVGSSGSGPAGDGASNIVDFEDEADKVAYAQQAAGRQVGGERGERAVCEAQVYDILANKFGGIENDNFQAAWNAMHDLATSIGKLWTIVDRRQAIMGGGLQNMAQNITQTATTEETGLLEKLKVRMQHSNIRTQSNYMLEYVIPQKDKVHNSDVVDYVWKRAPNWTQVLMAVKMMYLIWYNEIMPICVRRYTHNSSLKLSQQTNMLEVLNDAFDTIKFNIFNVSHEVKNQSSQTFITSLEDTCFKLLTAIAEAKSNGKFSAVTNDEQQWLEGIKTQYTEAERLSQDRALQQFAVEDDLFAASKAGIFSEPLKEAVAKLLLEITRHFNASIARTTDKLDDNAFQVFLNTLTARETDEMEEEKNNFDLQETLRLRFGGEKAAQQFVLDMLRVLSKDCEVFSREKYSKVLHELVSKLEQFYLKIVAKPSMLTHVVKKPDITKIGALSNTLLKFVDEKLWDALFGLDGRDLDGRKILYQMLAYICRHSIKISDKGYERWKLNEYPYFLSGARHDYHDYSLMGNVMLHSYGVEETKLNKLEMMQGKTTRMHEEVLHEITLTEVTVETLQKKYAIICSNTQLRKLFQAESKVDRIKQDQRDKDKQTKIENTEGAEKKQALPQTACLNPELYANVESKIAQIDELRTKAVIEWTAQHKQELSQVTRLLNVHHKEKDRNRIRTYNMMLDFFADVEEFEKQRLISSQFFQRMEIMNDSTNSPFRNLRSDIENLSTELYSSWSIGLQNLLLQEVEKAETTFDLRPEALQALKDRLKKLNWTKHKDATNIVNATDAFEFDVRSYRQGSNSLMNLNALAYDRVMQVCSHEAMKMMLEAVDELSVYGNRRHDVKVFLTKAAAEQYDAMSEEAKSDTQPGRQTALDKLNLSAHVNWEAVEEYLESLGDDDDIEVREWVKSTLGISLFELSELQSTDPLVLHKLIEKSPKEHAFRKTFNIAYMALLQSYTRGRESLLSMLEAWNKAWDALQILDSSIAKEPWFRMYDLDPNYKEFGNVVQAAAQGSGEYKFIDKNENTALHGLEVRRVLYNNVPWTRPSLVLPFVKYNEFGLTDQSARQEELTDAANTTKVAVHAYWMQLAEEYILTHFHEALGISKQTLQKLYLASEKKAQAESRERLTAKGFVWEKKDSKINVPKTLRGKKAYDNAQHKSQKAEMTEKSKANEKKNAAHELDSLLKRFVDKVAPFRETMNNLKIMADKEEKAAEENAKETRVHSKDEDAYTKAKNWHVLQKHMQFLQEYCTRAHGVVISVKNIDAYLRARTLNATENFDSIIKELVKTKNEIDAVRDTLSKKIEEQMKIYTVAYEAVYNEIEQHKTLLLREEKLQTQAERCEAETQKLKEKRDNLFASFKLQSLKDREKAKSENLREIKTKAQKDGLMYEVNTRTEIDQVEDELRKLQERIESFEEDKEVCVVDLGNSEELLDQLKTEIQETRKQIEQGIDTYHKKQAKLDEMKQFKDQLMQKARKFKVMSIDEQEKAKLLKTKTETEMKNSQDSKEVDSDDKQQPPTRDSDEKEKQATTDSDDKEKPRTKNTGETKPQRKVVNWLKEGETEAKKSTCMQKTQDLLKLLEVGKATDLQRKTLATELQHFKIETERTRDIELLITSKVSEKTKEALQDVDMAETLLTSNGHRYMEWLSLSVALPGKTLPAETQEADSDSSGWDDDDDDENLQDFLEDAKKSTVPQEERRSTVVVEPTAGDGGAGENAEEDQPASAQENTTEADSQTKSQKEDPRKGVSRPTLQQQRQLAKQAEREKRRVRDTDTGEETGPKEGQGKKLTKKQQRKAEQQEKKEQVEASLKTKGLWREREDREAPDRDASHGHENGRRPA